MMGEKLCGNPGECWETVQQKLYSVDCDSISSKMREASGSVGRSHSSEEVSVMEMELNPKIRGWINYYTRFNRQEALEVFGYLNDLIRKWLKNKYKLKTAKAVYVMYKAIQSKAPEMFYHWKLGIKL